MILKICKKYVSLQRYDYLTTLHRHTQKYFAYLHFLKHLKQYHNNSWVVETAMLAVLKDESGYRRSDDGAIVAPAEK